MTDPTVSDGPNTELAEAEAWFREDPKRLDFAPITEWSRHLRTIVRAYLARPAAGRDLTAQDVHDAVVAWNVAPGEPDRDQFLAGRLNAVVRPAVARTDVQPPADPQSHSRDVVEVPRGRLTEWYGLLRKAVDATVSPLAGDLSAASGEVAYWGQQPAAPADDTASTTPFTVDQEVRSASGVRGTVRTANYTYSLVTWSNGNVVWVRNDELAPADDTAGQDEPAPGITAWQGQLLDARAAVSYAIEESISEFVSQRVDERGGGFEADPSEAARIAVDALVMAGWRPAPADDTAAPDDPTHGESMRQERDFLAGCLRASSTNEAKYVEDSVTLTQLLTWLRRTATQWRTGSTVLERDRKIRTSCAESLESLIEQVVPSVAGQPVRDSQDGGA